MSSLYIKKLKATPVFPDHGFKFIVTFKQKGKIGFKIDVNKDIEEIYIYKVKKVKGELDKFISANLNIFQQTTTKFGKTIFISKATNTVYCDLESTLYFFKKLENLKVLYGKTFGNKSTSHSNILNHFARIESYFNKNYSYFYIYYEDRFYFDINIPIIKVVERKISSPNSLLRS